MIPLCSREGRSRGPLPEARGTSLMEFLLSIVTVMFVLFWMWEGTMVVYTYSVLSDSAKEGVRYASVHGPGNSNCSGPAPSTASACPDPSANNVAAVVKDYAGYSFQNISAIQVAVSYPDSTNAASNRIRVVVNYDYVPYLKLPWNPPHLKAVADGRVMN